MQWQNTGRERESSKKKHPPETMQSPLLDGKKGVGIVSVSIPSEGCSSLQKEKEKKNRTDTSKENHRNSLPSLLSPWWGGLLMLRTSHGRAA